MKPSGYLTRAARTSRDVEAVASGRVAERVTNRLIGRLLGKVTRGLWR